MGSSLQSLLTSYFLFDAGFCKASFLPLLEFAYTSELTFDFCNMAELAVLARHLFMTEVLEICENVHKQMEDKQITVYQKGDVQVVEVAQNLLEPTENGTNPADGNEQPSPTEDAVATVNGAYSSTEVEELTETEAVLQTVPEPPVENPPSPVEHSTDIQTSESNEKAPVEEVITDQSVIVDQSVSLEQSEHSAAEQEVISTPGESEADKNVCSEQNITGELTAEAAAEDSQEGLKRKRGRPCKTQSIPLSQSETSVSSQDDTYKSKLRQRSVSEGGYIKLHKGIEKKLQNRKPANKSAIQQVKEILQNW